MEVCDKGVRLCLDDVSGGTGGSGPPRDSAEKEQEFEEILSRHTLIVDGAKRDGARGVGLDEGQWCICESRRARHWARKVQRADSGERFACEKRYQRMCENGVWESVDGLVPSHSKVPVRVWVTMTARGNAELR